MKKRKTYEVSVINKTYSKTYSDDTKFYTSDTALELNFQLKEVEYDFDSAEIILLNIDDRSLVTRPVVKSAEGFTYELEDDIVEHYGEWKGQLKFNEGGEVYVSSPVIFRIENDLNNDRPPKLTEVNTWKNLREFADKLIIDLQIEQDETLGFLENRQDTVENKFDSLQQEITNKDVISAPEIIAARNGEANLKARLDKEQQEVTAQLAQKLNKGGVTVADINKNYGLLDETYMTPEFREQMAGNTPLGTVPAPNSLVTEQYADESVTNTKLNKNIIKYIPTNLDDYTWEIGGMYLGNDQPSPSRIRTRNGEYVRLYAGDVVTVGKNYQVLLALFNANKSYVSDTGWKTNTFTVLTSGLYRLVVQKTAVSDFTQSELANLPVSFELRRVNWDTNNFVKTETIDNEKLKPVVNRHLHFNLTDLEWEHGAIFNGYDTVATNRMRTKAGQYVYLETGDVVRVGLNKSIVPVCYNKFGEFIGASIENWNAQEHTVILNGYYRFVVEKGNASDLTQKEIELYPKNFILEKKAVKQLHETIALKTQIEMSLPSTSIISDPSVETMAHASMIYADTFSNDGTVWGAYYANDTATIESPSNTGTYINLIKFNLLDPSNVKKMLAIKVGVPVGGYTITGRAPYDPNLFIKQDSVILVFNSYIDGKVTLGTLEFDKQTETFSNYQTSQLTYEAGGVTSTVDFDVVGLRTAYEVMTGETLTGDLEDLCVSTTFVEHNGYKYNTACQIFYDVGFKGMIIRTLDGINYEVVAIPKSAPASAIESTIEIVGDRIIYAQRGGLNYISAYNMTSGSWDEWLTIPDMTSSKNALMYINGKLLLVYTSSNQLTTDWGKIQRSGFSIKEVNPETLEMKNVVDFQSPFGIHYPCLMKYKGDLYMSYSEDRNKLDVTQTRSNIAFIPLTLG